MAAHKYGKRKPHSEATHPRVKLADHLAVTPAVPAVVDWASAVSDWPVYMNTQIGDCTCAAMAHMVQAWTTYSESATVTLSDQDVMSLYEAVGGYDPYTGTGDNGAVEQDVLAYVQKNGIGGHKIRAYAQVDHKNPVAMKQALDIFGSVYVGLQVPQSAEQQFTAGAPWVPVTGSPIMGGHAVNIQKWDADYIYAVTWGRLQTISVPFWLDYGDEAWVIITDDWINKNSGLTPTGLNLQGLLDEFDSITGQAPVVPAPSNPGCNLLARWVKRLRKA